LFRVWNLFSRGNAMIRRPIACTGLVLLAWAAAGLAQNDKVTIDGVQLGTPVSGPQLTPADLKGKVVLVEIWGMN
jgi:hypothetical protein